MENLTTPARPLPPALLAPAPRAPAAARPGTPAEQVRTSAQEFEAVFIAQMLKPMFETVEVSDTFGGGSAEDIWRGIQVEEYGKMIARHGGIGLAPVVEREMLRLQEAHQSPGAQR